MSVTSVQKDPEAKTMTIVSEFGEPIDRVWQMWSDPRRLERWWGPPTHPATVVDHDLSPGGTVTYFMTGPQGGRSHGWWRIVTADRPHHLEFIDGFADADGEPNPDMPVSTIRVDLGVLGGGTRMSIATTFPSVEVMDQMIEMGMEDGMKLAVGQIDDILREDANA